MSGSVVHFEIPAEDLERAQNFYREAFGWNITRMSDMEYMSLGTTESGPDGMPTTPGAINGGLFRRDGALTSPVVTIDVDDIEAALAKVGELGGKTVTPKTAVGNMGFAAYFTDTEDNLMGMWQSATPSS